MSSQRTARCMSGRKQRWHQSQLVVLQAYMATQVLPPRAHRDFLAMLLGTSSRRVQIWYQNRRAGQTTSIAPLIDGPFVYVDQARRDPHLTPTRPIRPLIRGADSDESASDSSESALAKGLRLQSEDASVVGDLVFSELRTALDACAAGLLTAALTALVTLVDTLIECTPEELFRARQDRRFAFSVLITCVGEVVKHWARRVVTATNPAFDVVAHITCAYDAVTRLDRFANQATIADICRSTLGSLAGAIVLLDETVVVSNEVLDSLDLLYHQSAVVITEPIMLATIACVLPSTGERPEAHGLQTRLTLDGVIDAPDDCALVVNNTARPIRSLPSGSTKRDRSIDGVTGVRAVSTKSSDYGAPAHTAVAPRAWTPLVLPSALFPMLPPMYMPLDYASASTASTTTLLDAAAPLYSSAAPAVAASTTVANSGIAFSPIRSLDSPLEPPAAPQARAPLVSSDPPLGITSGIARLSLHGDEVEPQLQRDAITQHLEPAHTSNSPEPSPRTLDDDGVGNNGDAPAPATLPPIESLLTNPDEILNNFVPVSPTGGIKEEPETSTDVDVEQWLKDAWLKTEAIEPTHPSIQ